MKNHINKIKLTLIACFAILALQSNAAVQATKNYAGVTIEDLTLYSSASDNAYEVGSLPKGSIVHVLDLKLSHFRVIAPAGVYSYIRKTDIKLTSSGDRGQVTAKRAQVRVAHKNGYQNSKRTHKTLHQGSIVRIVRKSGNHGNYYLIIPPQGAPIYIKPDLVRHATAQEVKLGRAADAPSSDNQKTRPQSSSAKENS